MKNSIYKNVKELCEKQNLSIRALEQKANVANATIRKWENKAPRVDTLQKVADALGVSVTRLLK